MKFNISNSTQTGWNKVLGLEENKTCTLLHLKTTSEQNVFLSLQLLVSSSPVAPCQVHAAEPTSVFLLEPQTKQNAPYNIKTFHYW